MISSLFYRKFNPDLNHLNNIQLLKHWNLVGQFEPSRIHSIESFYHHYPDFQCKLYKSLNPDLPFKDDIEYMVHWHLWGKKENRKYIIEPPEQTVSNITFLMILSSRKSIERLEILKKNREGHQIYVIIHGLAITIKKEDFMNIYDEPLHKNKTDIYRKYLAKISTEWVSLVFDPLDNHSYDRITVKTSEIMNVDIIDESLLYISFMKKGKSILGGNHPETLSYDGMDKKIREWIPQNDRKNILISVENREMEWILQSLSYLPFYEMNILLIASEPFLPNSFFIHYLSPSILEDKELFLFMHKVTDYVITDYGKTVYSSFLSGCGQEIFFPKESEFELLPFHKHKKVHFVQESLSLPLQWKTPYRFSFGDRSTPLIRYANEWMIERWKISFNQEKYRDYDSFNEYHTLFYFLDDIQHLLLLYPYFHEIYIYCEDERKIEKISKRMNFKRMRNWEDWKFLRKGKIWVMKDGKKIEINDEKEKKEISYFEENTDGYCIHLDDRIDRWDSFHMEREKFPFLNVRIFPAIKPTIKMIRENENIINNKQLMLKSESYILGAYGCKWSHLELLKTIKTEKKYVVIMEDDILIEEHARDDISKALQEIEEKEIDFDILYLAVHLKEESDAIKISDSLLKIKKGLTTTGFILQVEKIPMIIQCLKNNSKEIDNSFQDELIHKYCVYPMCIYQKESWSDITNQMENYGEYHKKYSY